MSQDSDPILEYEVFNVYLEPTLPPVICRSQADAQRILDNFIKLMNEARPQGLVLPYDGGDFGWKMREVILNQRPIPQWSPLPRPITVEEGRRLASAHGQDRVVIIAWNDLDKSINAVTIGSNAIHAQAAVELGSFLMKTLGYDVTKTYEDRRHEHEQLKTAPAGTPTLSASETAIAPGQPTG